jgi:FkbM family methyltransferase
MTAVDLGANIGYFTLLLARAVGPGGRVVAFEPDPVNAELLRRNVADNGYAQAEVVQAAVADHDGSMMLWQDPANFGDHRVRAAAMDRPGVPVPVVRLDGALPPGTRVDFIKMDIQGAEQAALAGARRVLTENRDVVLAAEFWADGIREYGGDPRAMLHDLAELGFTLAILGEPGTVPRPVAGEAERDALAAGSKTVDLIGCRSSLRLAD